jgi:hypothetical protein
MTTTPLTPQDIKKITGPLRDNINAFLDATDSIADDDFPEEARLEVIANEIIPLLAPLVAFTAMMHAERDKIFNEETKRIITNN